jgi:hypothetical protein
MIKIIAIMICSSLCAAELSYGLQYVYWNGNDYDSDSERYRDAGVTLDIDNFYMHHFSASGVYRGMDLGCTYIQQFADFGSDFGDEIGDRIVGYIGKHLSGKVTLRAKGEFGKLEGEYKVISYNRDPFGNESSEVIDSGTFKNKYSSISLELVYDMAHKYGHPCRIYTGISYKRYKLPSLHEVKEPGFTGHDTVAMAYDPDYSIDGFSIIILGGEAEHSTRFGGYSKGHIGLGMCKIKVGQDAMESLRKQSKENTSIFGSDPDFEDDEWMMFGEGNAELGAFYDFTDSFRMSLGFRVSFMGGGNQMDDNNTNRYLDASRFDFYYGPILTATGTF